MFEGIIHKRKMKTKFSGNREGKGMLIFFARLDIYTLMIMFRFLMLLNVVRRLFMATQII